MALAALAREKFNSSFKVTAGCLIKKLAMDSESRAAGIVATPGCLETLQREGHTGALKRIAATSEANAAACAPFME